MMSRWISRIELSHSDGPWDYTWGVSLLESRTQRFFLIAAGWLCIALGVIGAFLPLLPTTPFLLLAAACFARSSPRLYQAMLSHPWVGPPLREWRESRTIPFRAKVLALSMITLSMGSSIVLFVPHWMGKTLMGLGGIAICLYIVKIPTRKNIEQQCDH